jgi:ATP-binding cassette subfamily C protein
MSIGGHSGAVRQAIHSCRRHARAIFAFSAVLNLLHLAPTLYMLQIYERAIPTQSQATLLFMTLFVLLALGMLAMLDHLRTRLLIRGGVLIDRELGPQVLRAAISGGATAESRQAMREFDALRQVLSGPSFAALCDLPWTPIYVVACFLVHPAIGALGLVGLVLLPLLVWRHDRGTREPLERAQQAAARSYVSQDQMLADRDAIRALGMAPAMIERQLRLRREMLELQTSASFSAGRYGGWSRFTRLSLQSLALGLGAWLAIHNQVSAGAVFAASFLIARALSPVEQLIGAWKSLSQAGSGYRMIERLVDGSVDDNSFHTALPAPKGALQLEQVSLNQPFGDGKILENVSFEVQPGEVVAVIGPSGAGKTSLMRVIAGLTRPSAGDVRFDGAEQRDWDLNLLARHLGYLPQEPSLFAGTVKENICRFDNELSSDAAAVDAAVIEAATSAGAHDFILRLQGGYDYPSLHRGANLSSGQAQRVAFARSLYGRPPILLLDEPNAHLDNEGDAKLVSTLQRLKEEGVTILVVSHRLSILPAVDKILVMRGGRVHLFGPRDEVLPKVTAPNVRAIKPQQAAG